MSSPDQPGGANSVARRQRKAWIALILTGLVLGSAFIGVHVGIQRYLSAMLNWSFPDEQGSGRMSLRGQPRRLGLNPRAIR